MARNKTLAEKFRELPCIVCGNTPSEGDHIKNYAGNPDRDVEFNIWPLCRAHHRNKHDMGLTKFVEQYRLWDALKERGFYWDVTYKKYRHEKL